MRLEANEFPEHEEKRIIAINELSDEQLDTEIENGARSRQFSDMIPILKAAKNKRDSARSATEREKEIELSVESNDIAKSALEEARIANQKADTALLWSGIAILVSVILAAINYFSGGS